MKKCDNCGAVQSDDRIFCVDCGERLGRPMSKADEEAHLSAIDASVEHMADPSDDFAVSRVERIFGVLALVGIAALCVLLCVIGVVEDRYQPEYPNGTVLSDTGGKAVILSGGTLTSVDIPYSAERDALSQAAVFSVGGILMLVWSAVMLFFPRVFWYLDTIRIRHYISGEPTPSAAWVITHKVVQYATFAIGWGCVIWVICLLP